MGTTSCCITSSVIGNRHSSISDSVTIAQGVLEFIKAAASEGRQFTDIQREYCRLAGRPFTRGVACTNLVAFHSGYFAQSRPGHFGLLYTWCKKNDAGKWVLSEEPVTPFYRGYKNYTSTYADWCLLKGMQPPARH